MRLELREHKGYDDGDVVHHVTEIVGHLKEGEKYHRNHHYPITCKGLQAAMQHIHYTDAPVTCMPCLAAYQPGRVKCRRTACNRVLPVAELWIHTQSGEQYCSTCAGRINEHDANLVVPQS